MLPLTLTHTHTQTKPMPTNSPILPFLVLTMAGGCRVSNLMKPAENNSWVCVEMVGRGGGGRGRESRHKCPCQSQGQRDSCTDSNNEPNKTQEKETAAIFLTFHLSEHEPLLSVLSGWLEGARERSARQAGRQAWLQQAWVIWDRQQGCARPLRPSVCSSRI